MNVESILPTGKRNTTYVAPKKLGRNDPCTCDEGVELGLKHKQCCGNVRRRPPVYNDAGGYSDKMGEQGVFAQMAEEIGITKDTALDEISDLMKKEVYKNSKNLLGKIYKKYNKNSTVQSGMFSDVLQIANFMGGFCEEKFREIESLKSQLAIAEDQLLRLKSGADETNSVPEGSKQAS